MDALGLIFADSFYVDLGELVSKRTLAAVPFGGRYRVIDFILSNMANAGVRNIGIITTQNYYSLMNHVRSGAVWDLDRNQSGLIFLPPFSGEPGNRLFQNRLEYLQANISYIKNAKEKYVIMSSCSYVGNIDLQKALDFHIENSADITGVYKQNPINKRYSLTLDRYDVDDQGVLIDVDETDEGKEGNNVALGLYIMEREYLMKVVYKSIRENKKSFREDILVPAIAEGRAAAYQPDEQILYLDDLSGYLMSNLNLLESDLRDQIFQVEDRPILTRVKDSPPTRYGKDAVTSNSLIADGAIIDGEVRNSVIFRGVKIKKGAIVENSVIMQDTTIGEGAHINYSVLDKYVTISGGITLSGYLTHPFYVEHKTVI